MSDSPTTRTLKHLRGEGFICDVAEYWQSSFAQSAVVSAAKSGRGMKPALAGLAKAGPGRRIDLFGFIDIVALRDGIVGIQTTTTGNAPARKTKILTECSEAAKAWLKAGGIIEVWGWKKYAKAIDRKFWRPTVTEITADDFATVKAPF